MAPRLRIEYPGAIYHVICRGNNRQNIFKDDPRSRLALWQSEVLPERLVVSLKIREDRIPVCFHVTNAFEF
jgi:hypothetical protein